ncbi:MAG TPA: cation:proton antiporter [Candidatus Limnocylindrales bacterium]|nr:cation:proton antiporter [Candidatus Limnocylindrales bacterium]
MTDDAALTGIRIFVALLAAAIVVALITHRIRLPYTVGLVVLGLVVGIVRPGAGVAITPGLVLAVLLPGLIFEAAFRTDLAALRPSLLGVLFLAIPGVLIVAVVVAIVLQAATGLAFSSAFVVGAMVAATDPAAVIATFKRLRAPNRLATAVEAESLLNDGTGIVVFTIALAATTGPSSLADGIVRFVLVVAASAIWGTAAGWLASQLFKLTDDHLVELTVTLVLAYGAYLVADAVGGSGIIATTAAGVTLGVYGRRHGLSSRAAESIDLVWEFIAFLLTALIFLLIGLAIDLQTLLAELVPIAWTVVAVLLARAFVVYVLLGGSAKLAGRGRTPVMSLGWLHVVFWAGLRGAVSVALVLSLPAGLPDRPLIGSIVFGVVLFTLLVQGSTAEFVIGRALGQAGSAQA